MFSEVQSDRQKVAEAIGKAAREVGFFYAQNHSVPEEIIGKTFDAVEKFFALPMDDKMEVHIHKSQSIRGYEPPFETKLDPNSKGGKHWMEPLKPRCLKSGADSISYT